MRWQALFVDLEAQLAAEEAAELAAEVAERARAEVGAVPLVDRLRAHVGSPVVLRTSSGPVRGSVEGVGSDVVLLVDETARHVLVPLGAVVTVSGLGRSARPPASPLLGRLGLRHVLRELGRERRPVRVETPATTVPGLVRRVAADHVDVVRRPLDDVRPWVEADLTETIPLTAIVSVRPA